MKFRNNEEDVINEEEAIKVGLALVDNYKADGNSDFDIGMKALQRSLGIKMSMPPEQKIMLR